MPLSKQDQDFYEDKLSLRNFYYLLGVTIVMGAFIAPTFFYLQDVSAGLAARWTLNVAFDWALIGMMLGTIISLVMYLGFRFLLSMGWLPSRQ
jgi:hypothetical protein